MQSDDENLSIFLAHFCLRYASEGQCTDFGWSVRVSLRPTDGQMPSLRVFLTLDKSTTKYI